jgi:hypothetical protein
VQARKELEIPDPEEEEAKAAIEEKEISEDT